MTASKALILKTAAALAARQGFLNITREQIAAKAEVAPASISYHFKSMTKLRDAIMAHAVEKGILEVIGQGLAARHRAAVAAPVALRQKAAQLLV